MPTAAVDASPVLNYFHSLENHAERPPTPEVLRGLAELFEATRVGISKLDGSPAETINLNGLVSPAPAPWQNDHSLILSMQTSLTAKTHHDKQGAWLMSLAAEPQAGEPFVCWAFRPRPAFGDADRSAWAFASQALLRWRAQNEPYAALQQRLESTALLTSRLIHDFGNHLTGIMGFTELSQGQVDSESTLGRYLQEVMLSAKQGADWIRRLHFFSRRGQNAAWPILLSGIVHAEQARVRGSESNLRWHVNVPIDLPLLAIDAAALQTVLSEIITNTREATRDQGTLTIEARKVELTEKDARTILGAITPGAYVELRCQDDGPGFSAEAAAKLFHDIFFSSKPRHRGLGLLVVYGILQRFRGGLRWHPGGQGRGASMQLYIPVAQLDKLPQLSGSPDVLLVHDDPQLLESMRRILEARGARVTAVNTAAAALSAYQTPKQSFDLVLADVLLPNVSGLEMGRKLLDWDPRAKFLFVYSQSSLHGIADDELIKRFPLLRWPADATTFVQAVQTALTPAKKSESGKSGR